MFTIKFYIGHELGREYPLEDFSDVSIEAAREQADHDLEEAGQPRLVEDSRHDFPSFTVYEDGEELGGG